MLESKREALDAYPVESFGDGRGDRPTAAMLINRGRYGRNSVLQRSATFALSKC